MRLPFFLLLPFVFFGCQNDQEINETITSTIQWTHLDNDYEASETEAYFTLVNGETDSLQQEWEIHFSAFMGAVTDITDGYEILHLEGEYYALRPTSDFTGLPPGEQVRIDYRSGGTTIKETMAPKGFFLIRNGKLTELKWSQTPMNATATFGGAANDKLVKYRDPDFLYENYPEDLGASELKVIPTPNVIEFTADKGIGLAKYQSGGSANSNSSTAATTTIMGDRRLHVWSSGVWWHAPTKVLKQWLAQFYDVELVIHQEDKPNFPHLELIYERTIAPEAYEIFNMSTEMTVVSASDPAGMLYGLATVLQSLHEESDGLYLPLAKVQDAPRFPYRGQHLDVSRNFQSKASVLRLLDLMALFKLNKFHFHLSDDEGWRLEIPDLPELTTVGATRGYTPDESDRIKPAYGSGGSGRDTSGTGFYSRADFIEILQYAELRQIEVIPEIDLPGHARAAIKALEAYARRTGDKSYAISHPDDKSQYRSIQSYPDNVIDVCSESTYKFLDKVVTEIALMYEEAESELLTLHTGGDEVPYGVWTGNPACLDLKKGFGVDTEKAEEVKNLFSAYFLGRFKEILDEKGLRTAGWEEIGMEREAIAENDYRWKVNPDFADQNMLAYVWNSLGGNLDLGYRMANAGYDVVLANVQNFYFDLAYNPDPAEGGLYWGGFVDTYRPWAFAPYDVAKTVPKPWYAAGDGPTEAELRTDMVTLKPEARDKIVGIQGQLWSETVRGDSLQEHYLWPKMLGLAERAWSAPAAWEEIDDPESRKAVMKSDWAYFANRVGYHALPLLDSYGIRYRLSPPGAMVVDGQIKVRTAFPGTRVYATSGEEWSAPTVGEEGELLIEPGHELPDTKEPIYLRSGTGDRRSLAVELRR
ncbi:hypothetical protein CEQ90_18020 [Lewinellaceae bacterium SD302]|nr:hypothetical protein CEQ90_18020 [Lewinellaceae bacterium SD302]